MGEERSETRDEEAAPDNEVKNAETIVDHSHTKNKWLAKQKEHTDRKGQTPKKRLNYKRQHDLIVKKDRVKSPRAIASGQIFQTPTRHWVAQMRGV